MTTALVTGGAGAIGGNLVQALLDRGIRVTVLDDLSSGHRSLVPQAADFIHGSVTDKEAVEAAFRGRPEFVFHLAALFANQNSVDHPDADLLVNGQGMLNVLDAAQRHGTRKLLYTSSSCVYGNKAVMAEQDVEFDLDTPYAITKLLGEHYLDFWSRHHGMHVVTARLFNAYGPGEYPGRYRNVVPNFLQLAMRGEPLPITGTGDETRDFTFIGDIVAGLMLAMFSDTESGEVFNLASGREERILSLAEKINRLTGNRAGVEMRPRRNWDRVSRRRGDIAKAQRILGYEPKVMLDEGLERTYEWLKRALA